MRRRGIAIVLSLLLTAHCAPVGRSRRHAGETQPRPLVLSDPEPIQRLSWSVQKSADPCENFYAYACGGWFETLVPPAGYAVWGQGLYELDERARRSLWQLLAAEESPPDPRLADARAFYAACMADHPGNLEVASLHEPLRELDGVRDADASMRALARLHRVFVPAAFTMRVGADPAEAARTALFLQHGGLGLPFPQVYLSGGTYLKMREAYRKYMTETFELVESVRGQSEVESEQAYAIEKILAELAPHRLDLAPDQANHATSPAKLAETSTAVPWGAYFDELGVPPDARVVIDSPYFFEHFDRVLHRPESFSTYLRWLLLHATIDLLPEGTRRQHASIWPGSPNESDVEPRWSMCARTTAEVHSGALVEAYRRTWPPPGHVDAAKQISRRVSTSLAEMIDAAKWSDPEAKAAAKQKIGALRWTVDRPADPGPAVPIALRQGDHLANTVALRRQASDRLLAGLGGPVVPGPLALPPFSSASVYLPTSATASSGRWSRSTTTSRVSSFLLGTDTRLRDAAGAAEHAAAHPGTVVVVADESEPAFLAALEHHGARARRATTIEGFNYSKGRRLRLALYVVGS